ncbi:MAG: hypothetical protein PVI43_00335 [Candidatus Bathyarchaeota archaeon]|jgi:hypothetical protein
MIERLELAKKKADDILLVAFVTSVHPKVADSLLVDFAEHKMRERLKEKRENGYNGWNTPQCENSDLKTRLIKNVESEDWVDVANLAAMLLARTSMFEEVELRPRAD